MKNETIEKWNIASLSDLGSIKVTQSYMSSARQGYNAHWIVADEADR